MLTPYQFQCPHYCEKARWALDYKGIAYETRNLIPGPHRRTSRPKVTYPSWSTGGRVMRIR